MATSTRQPFAELGSTRIQGLQSAKNRQNGKEHRLTCAGPSLNPRRCSSRKFGLDTELEALGRSFNG